MADTDVLIAGTGHIGLTAAIELARRGVGCRIIDPVRRLLWPGLPPGMRVLRRSLDAAIQMRAHHLRQGRQDRTA